MSRGIIQGNLLMKDLYIHVLHNCVCFSFKHSTLNLCLWNKAYKDKSDFLWGEALQQSVLDPPYALCGPESISGPSLNNQGERRSAYQNGKRKSLKCNPGFSGME